MTIELSPQQSEALRNESNVPVLVIDPQSDRRYVLLSEVDYQVVRALFEHSDFDIRDAYPAQDRVAISEGWDTPEMDDYNDYDAHRK